MGDEHGAKTSDVIDDEEEDEVFPDESFFINESYDVRSFHYGPHSIDVFCLQSSATDYDLTGQMIWPGSKLMNNFIMENSKVFLGQSVIELGSGVGLTGILCGLYCEEVVMTDHNDRVLEVLKRNIDLQRSRTNCKNENLTCEKLEWGNREQLAHILDKHPKGFDIILGADICYQQDSIPPLFDTIQILLHYKQEYVVKCILAYVSRAKSVDAAVLREAHEHKLEVHEIKGIRHHVSDGVFEGVLYEVRSNHPFRQ